MLVHREVYKALIKTRGLFIRWQNLTDNRIEGTSALEADWATTELRNSLRSIEWDLEDLEDTISIVEKNIQKFKVDVRELKARRDFISATRDEVKLMKEKLNESNANKTTNSHKTGSGSGITQPLLNEKPSGEIVLFAKENTASAITAAVAAKSEAGLNTILNNTSKAMSRHAGAKYAKLENQQDSPSHYVGGSHSNGIHEQFSVQTRMLSEQEDQLTLISTTVGNLKNVSRQIGSELDDQSVILDEFDRDIDQTESRLDSSLKRAAKVLHLNNGKNVIHRPISFLSH